MSAPSSADVAGAHTSTRHLVVGLRRKRCAAAGAAAQLLFPFITSVNSALRPAGISITSLPALAASQTLAKLPRHACS